MSNKHLVLAGALLCAWHTGRSVQAQDCSDLLNPDQVLTFYVTMDPLDWETLRFSCPDGVCDPPPHSYFQALLQCESEAPILVGIRQKSDLPEPSALDPQKVSLKIDINRFVPDQLFAGKKKLSLENGGEGATVSEGLGWQFYQAAGGFVSGRSAWVNVYVNGDYKGLYSNVEQVDKVFLTDHGLDDGGFLLKEEDPRTRENPPELNVFAFNWYPFDHADPLLYPPEPTPPDWRDQALWRVNMPALLALAAAENFISNTDALVQKMTNYFYYDWSILPGDDPAGQQPRLYFPWDLDTLMKSQEAELDILDSGSGHLQEGLIEELDEAGDPFAEPTFQADYFTIYKNLLNGPLALSQSLALIDNLEPVISADMDADPHHQTGSAAGEFQRLRDFIRARTNSLIAQLAALGQGYPLQTSVVGNGSIIRNPDKPTVYDAGEVVELTAVAAPGWHFGAWTNGVGSTDNPLFLTMDAPKAVTAIFASVGQTVVVYDFGTNAGVDRFAYGTYTDSWSTDLAGIRQQCPEVCTEVTTVQAEAYDRLALSDALGGDADTNRYVNPDEGSQDESTLIAEFKIAQDPSSVLQIDALWEGYGNRRHHLELYVWNYVQGDWGNGAGLFGENNFMDDGSGDNDFILSGSVTTRVSEYISPDGQVTLLIYDDAHSEASFHDYMRLVVTVPAAECYVDGDCDDGVGCSDDTCVSGSCVFTPDDGNCNDGLFCNGAETCDEVLDCQAGTPVNCDDAVGCTDDSCNETTDSCDNIPDDAACDDGLYCNGAETCDPQNDCQAGIDPCPGQVCDELTDTCLVDCVTDPDCDDGLYCNGAETCLGGTCQPGSPVDCSDGVSCTDDTCDEATDSCDNVANDANCDNGLYCDGVETCDLINDCQPGAPVECDDGVGCTDDSCNETTDACDNVPNDVYCDNGQYCDGAETCDPLNDCQPGAPVGCDDGVACTDDSCNEATDSCDNVPDDAYCDNGLYCDGAETCDPLADCQAGTDPCPGQLCDEDGDFCYEPDCDNDGVCEEGEDCNNCPNDCISGEGGGICGNGVCEPPIGEDCLSCPGDCNGKQIGATKRQFCCGDGDGTNPVDCGDPRCTSEGYACGDLPEPYCCGDQICEGAEDSFNCEVDCGSPPFCGDDSCDADEDQCNCPEDCGAPPASEAGYCADGIDNDCDDAVDCSDEDCLGDPACPTCLPKGDPCTLDSECCSSWCHRGVCK